MNGKFSDGKAYFGASLLLAVTTSAAYLRALNAPFHFDDKKALLYRPELHDITDLSKIFSFDPQLPRPLFHLSLALDWLVGKGDPFVFHLVNLILHIAVTLLLFDVFRRLLDMTDLKSGDTITRSEISNKKFTISVMSPHFLSAWLGALIFALHPALTESVTYIWSRSSVLCALFWLLSLDFYLIYRRNPGETRGPYGSSLRFDLNPLLAYIFSIFAFFAALASKEIAATLPGLLLLVEIRRKSLNKNIKEWLAVVPFFLIVGVELAVRIALTGRVAFGYGDGYLNHLAIQSRVAASYIGLLLWPVNLNVDHYVPPSFPMWEVALSAALLLVLIAAVIRFWKRSPAAFAIGWFLVTLSPFFFIPLKDQMVERNMYFPAMGFAMLLALAIRGLSKRSLKLSIYMAFSVIILFFMGTITRNNVWTSEWKLWADAHRKAPDKPRPYNYLGALSLEQGKFNKAWLLLEAGLKRAPFYAEAHHNMGVIALRRGDFERASYEFAVARANDPGMINAFVNQARAEILLNRNEKAEKLLKTAIERQPDRVDARVLLADMMRGRGDIRDAKQYLNDAFAIDPRYYEAALGMALLADQESNREDSLKWLATAIGINDNRPEAHQALGRLYGKGGDWPSAATEFDKAVALDPENPEIFADLGIAYMRLNRWDDARKAFIDEMGLRPGNPLPVLRLAALEEARGNKSEALKLFKRALGLDVDGKYTAELEKIIQRLQAEEVIPQ